MLTTSNINHYYFDTVNSINTINTFVWVVLVLFNK